jgi:hypothetical protein
MTRDVLGRGCLLVGIGWLVSALSTYPFLLHHESALWFIWTGLAAGMLVVGVWCLWRPRTAALVGVGLLLGLVLLSLAGCQGSGPVGTRSQRCIDYPKDAPLDSECDQ